MRAALLKRSWRARLVGHPPTPPHTSTHTHTPQTTSTASAAPAVQARMVRPSLCSRRTTSRCCALWPHSSSKCDDVSYADGTLPSVSDWSCLWPLVVLPFVPLPVHHMPHPLHHWPVASSFPSLLASFSLACDGALLLPAASDCCMLHSHVVSYRLMLSWRQGGGRGGA